LEVELEEVIPHLYVGGDTDYEKLKDRAGWSFCRCCKEGPGGHRDTLGYRTLGAPPGKNYLSVTTKDPPKIALNFIDVNDPNLIPPLMVEAGIEFIGKRLAAGDKVLVACNAGRSRGPSTALLYLVSIGDLPASYHAAFRIFKGIYPNYSPGIGMEHVVRQFIYRKKIGDRNV
jgi:hypothetical protein